MNTTSAPTKAAASELVFFLRSHQQREEEILAGYRELALELPTADLRYVARLVLAGEEQHHQLLADLAQTLAAFDDLVALGMPLPTIAPVSDPAVRQTTLGTLGWFVEREKQERTALERLAEDIEPTRETTLWPLLVQIMREDSERHLRLLRSMEAQLGSTDMPAEPERASNATGRCDDRQLTRLDRTRRRDAVTAVAQSGHMPVSTLVGAPVIRVEPGADMYRVAAVLTDNDVGLLVVGESDGVQGVISERDVSRAIAAQRDPATTTASDLAHTTLVWCDASATVDEVAVEMMDNYVRHVLVEEEGQLIGVVSARDLLGAYAVGEGDDD